jgi:hypothetical protein
MPGGGDGEPSSGEGEPCDSCKSGEDGTKAQHGVCLPLFAVFGRRSVHSAVSAVAAPATRAIPYGRG